MENRAIEYEVLVHRRVDKFLSSLDVKTRARVLEFLRDIRIYPEALRLYDSAKLSGFEHTFRVRLGKLRIIFHVDKTNRTMIVTRVAFRERAYE